jgi:hypothetical protein
MELQRGIGNQGVLRILQRQESSRKTNPGPLARLRTSEPGDVCEEEADHIANLAMSASLHSQVGNPSLRIRSGDDASPVSGENAGLWAASENPPRAPVTVPSSVNVRRPGGSFPDPHLLGARAYTLGNDVILGNDVDLGSAEGKWTLSHELVHVAQVKARGDSTVRRFVAGNLETQSIGPDYAMQLTDTELEQDIAFLEQRRAGLKPDSIDYQVASDNLTVLGQEADRRGYKSPALIRASLAELFNSTLAAIKRVVDFLPHLKAEFESVSWIIPWRPDPPAWPHDPMNFIYDQFKWMVDALSAASAMLNLSSETDHDVAIALLRQAGVRITAVMLGYSELRPLLYYLQAAIGIRYGGSWLDPVDLARPVENARARIAPDLAAFAKLETESIEAVAAASAATTQALVGEIPGYVKQHGPLIQIPKLPWHTEALLILLGAVLEMPGAGLAGEEGGFTLSIRGGMMPAFVGGGSSALTTIVISAEQIAALRRLVAIGAISLAGVSAALGTSFAVNLDVPPAVIDLIGEGPTAGAMQVGGTRFAGLARGPRHHVMPQEERRWFEERGMTGDLDIDEFTVDMEEAEHQAIHGGGNWRLGRTWSGEWNRHIMGVLRQQEAQLGRHLNPSEILNIVGREMRVYGIPMDFVPFR